ncbi:MAG: hypothetical protein ABS76_26540 [Pelagibacterium sp. SCN 64-44]|nr:MAG: hypothetical protein ABS76_26540 [Pelagibacterium sp. SCN 64-44]
MTITISDARDYWNSTKSAVRHPWAMLSDLKKDHDLQAIAGFAGTSDGFTVYDMDVADFGKWDAFSAWVQGQWRHYQRNAEASIGLGAGAGMSLPPAQRPTLKRAAERFGTTENAVASICRSKSISVGRRTVSTPAMRMTNPIVIRELQKRVEQPRRPAGSKFPRRKRIKADPARDADLIASFLATKGVTKLPSGCADGALYVTIEDGR